MTHAVPHTWHLGKNQLTIALHLRHHLKVTFCPKYQRRLWFQPSSTKQPDRKSCPKRGKCKRHQNHHRGLHQLHNKSFTWINLPMITHSAPQCYVQPKYQQNTYRAFILKTLAYLDWSSIIFWPNSKAEICSNKDLGPKQQSFTSLFSLKRLDNPKPLIPQTQVLLLPTPWPWSPPAVVKHLPGLVAWSSVRCPRIQRRWSRPPDGFWTKWFRTGHCNGIAMPQDYVMIHFNENMPWAFFCMIAWTLKADTGVG